MMTSFTPLFICSALLLCFTSSCMALDPKWNLVWNDEFTGNSVNRSKWAFEVDCWGGGNNELQCYTDRSQNVKVANGYLTLTALQERYTWNGAGCTNPNSCGAATRDYTSARLRTLYDPKGSWTYGRFEIRAKLPNGKHLWPAIWMLPTEYKYGTWAASGEIDIMEFRGQVPNKVEGTLHHSAAWPQNHYTGSGPITMPFDMTADFHVFSLEWDTQQIRWFVDDKQYFSLNTNRSWYLGSDPKANPYTKNGQPWDEKFHMILNLAVGGGFFPSGMYGTLTTTEAKNWANPNFVIDYVRVYQQQQQSTTTASPSPSSSTKPATSTINSSTTSKPATSTTAQPATSTTAKPVTSSSSSSTTSKPATSTTTTSTPGTTSSSGSSNWKLVWNDDFNGSSLNRSKWAPEVDCWGGGNGELQCFTSRPANLAVSGGNLYMVAVPERYTGSTTGCTRDGSQYCTATRDYTSARIRTLLPNSSSGSWKYGRVEIRAKFPRGSHLRPSILMLPTNSPYGSWAASGQIDLLQARGQNTTVGEGGLHYGAVWPNNKYVGSGSVSLPDLANNFRSIIFEWDEDQMTWSIDGKIYYRQQTSSWWSAPNSPYVKAGQPWNNPFHLIISLSVGGNAFPSAQYGTLSTTQARSWQLPCLVVDSVKIYQKV